MPPRAERVRESLPIKLTGEIVVFHIARNNSGQFAKQDALSETVVVFKLMRCYLQAMSFILHLQFGKFLIGLFFVVQIINLI